MCADIDRQQPHGSGDEQIGAEGKDEHAAHGAPAKQGAPLPTSCPQRREALPGEGEADGRGQQHDGGGAQEHDPQARLRGAARGRVKPLPLLHVVQGHREYQHRGEKAHGSPGTGEAVGVGSGPAERRQRDGYRKGDHRGREACQKDGRQKNEHEPLRQPQQHEPRRGHHGEEGHDPAPGAGAIRHLPPERLRDDAHQGHDGEDQAQLGAGQAGVLLQVEAVVGEENTQGAEEGEPEKRYGEALAPEVHGAESSCS